MPVKSVPTLGWTRGDIEATIRLVTQEQRQALARRVRAEMERQNFDNVRLARKSGVSEKTISRIINARLAPRYSTLERLSKALGIKDPDLWSGLSQGSPSARSKKTPDLAKALTSDPSQLDRLEAAIVDLRARLENIDAHLQRLDASVGGYADKLDRVLQGLNERPAGVRPASLPGKLGRRAPNHTPTDEDRPQVERPREAG